MTSRISKSLPADRNQVLRRTNGAATQDIVRSPEVQQAIATGTDFVLSQQDQDGTWPGTASPDIRTTAEYLAMCAWFGHESSDSAQASANWLRDVVQDAEMQRKLDVSTLALVRLALHLCGEATDSDLSRQLNASIRRQGSLPRADNVARIYFAIFNQISFAECDPMPPEFVLLPAWAPASLAHQDRWSRALRVPLSILASLHPQHTSIVPIHDVSSTASRSRRRLGPDSGMTVAQRISISALGLGEALGLDGLRKRALRHARQWIVTRISADSGVAGSMSATALCAIALSCVGCARTSPAISRCWAALDRCRHVHGGVAARYQPNLATAWAVSSLAATGMSTSEPAMNRAVEAILDREVTRAGDWADAVDAEPGGWSSEHDNDHYPDVTCTAATLAALRAHFATSPGSSLVTDDSMVAMIRANSLQAARQRIAVLDRVAAASRRARRWLLAMQRANGSWDDSAAHWHATADCDQRHLTAANTGFVLHALGRWEMRSGQAAVDRAVAYLRDAQCASGLWQGGGLLDYYATWLAIEGLLAVGVESHDETIRQATDALVALQNDDGGFSPSSVTEKHSTAKHSTTSVRPGPC